MRPPAGPQADGTQSFPSCEIMRRLHSGGRSLCLKGFKCKSGPFGHLPIHQVAHDTFPAPDGAPLPPGAEPHDGLPRAARSGGPLGAGGTPGRLPDAAHAAGVRPQLASLQLARHDLPLGLQLARQPLKLQFLKETTQEINPIVQRKAELRPQRQDGRGRGGAGFARRPF